MAYDFLAILAESIHCCYSNVHTNVYNILALTIDKHTDTQNCASGHVAFCTLSIFIEARVDLILTLKLCSLVRGLIKNEHMNVGSTTVVFPIPLIVLDRAVLRRELFAEQSFQVDVL